VEGETYGSSLTNKHVFEAQSSLGDLPKEDLAASNWVSGAVPLTLNPDFSSCFFFFVIVD